MYKQYPYEITFKLPSTGNKRFKERVTASHQNEAKKLFQAGKPSAIIVNARPLPQN